LFALYVSQLKSKTAALIYHTVIDLNVHKTKALSMQHDSKKFMHKFTFKLQMCTHNAVHIWP